MSEQASATHRVVINDEEQYSIWWIDRDPPVGWHVEGFTGSQEDCVAYIDGVWTDTRPASLRRRMAEQADNG
ncbi:MbtH family NRPS accessory protein [Micromonospora sp. NPDC051196]|uniref:MbtH family protein n=1 Tax=Micromonospora sp. NPDC051196 TaxID=3155281 RepID=UPI003427F907